MQFMAIIDNPLQKISSRSAINIEARFSIDMK